MGAAVARLQQDADHPTLLKQKVDVLHVMSNVINDPAMQVRACDDLDGESAHVFSPLLYLCRPTSPH